ncbi:MAG: hypothetical protein Q4D81_00400 [Eubacteriales bacterium]|nr:hypothetical protein [Eubacteriales bacterium]
MIRKRKAINAIRHMMDMDGFQDGDAVSRRTVIAVLDAMEEETMVGIQIPMPRTCDECRLAEDYECVVLHKACNWGFHERRSDCPLIDLSRYEDDLK